jgi:DNA-binding IscR family transcriptional regulator
MRRSPSKNFDASWATLIRETIVQGATGRPAGDGWLSVEEFAAKARISASHAGKVLPDMVKAGRAEMERGKIDGHWKKYYRPKP